MDRNMDKYDIAEHCLWVDYTQGRIERQTFFNALRQIEIERNKEADMFDGKCNCGSAKRNLTGSQLRKLYPECDICGEMMCRVCASDPTVGMDLNWHDTLWNVCRTSDPTDPDSCQYQAVEALRDEHEQDRKELHELKLAIQQIA